LVRYAGNRLRKLGRRLVDVGDTDKQGDGRDAPAKAARAINYG